MNKQILFAFVANVLILGACGGGGGGDGGRSGSTQPPLVLTYAVGGTVTGLDGSDLVLQNGSDQLGITGDGGFTFADAVASGDVYSVAATLQPTDPWQTCTVANGDGMVGGANVTNIDVDCTTNTYTVSGSVSGLAASGLVLHNSAGAGEDLAVPANASAFDFTSPVPSGERYDVSVTTDPTGQTCTLNDFRGEVAGEDITTVSVSCSASIHTIGGTVTGLQTQDLQSAGLVLSNDAGGINGGPEQIQRYVLGGFTFVNPQASGSQYIVSIVSQPTAPAQNCTVTGGSGSGTVTANVFSVVVDCSLPNTSGSLDPSFDADGIALTDFNGLADLGFAVAIQTDDKIVVAGSAGINAKTDIALARYLPDGSLDPNFGTGGRVTTDIAGGEDHALAIALQADGKIVVAGRAHVGIGFDFALVRYLPDGSLDEMGFGTLGKVTTDFGSLDYGQAVAIDPIDGAIVVAGRALVGSLFNFAVARYTANGDLDLGFDTDGKLTTDFNNDHDFGYAVAIQPDQRIVVAGYAENGADKDFAVARYQLNGFLDPSFDGDGKVTTNFGALGRADFGQTIALQANGGILVAGYTFNGVNNDFALVRYTDAGVLDTSFDTDGKVTTPIGGAGDEAYSMVLDTLGRIVVVGRSFNGVNNDFALARYDPMTGALDRAFGANGIVTTPVGSGDDEAYGVAIQQADGKIVAVGRADNGTNAGGNANVDFALIRIIP